MDMAKFWERSINTAYQQASSKSPAGNRDAALWLLATLRACIREEHGFSLTPQTRKILGDMLGSIIEGEDPAKALFLDSKSGNPQWVDRQRNNEIAALMSVVIDGNPGISTAAAARHVASLEKFNDSKTGKPLGWKRIKNIWLQYKKSPHERVTFGVS
jgi:hypothetical protein